MRVGTVLMAGITDMDGKELFLDADRDTSITADTDDVIDVKVAGVDQFSMSVTGILPTTDSDIDLGASGKQFKAGYINSHYATLRQGLPVLAANPANNGDISINTSNQLLYKSGGTVYTVHLIP